MHYSFLTFLCFYVLFHSCISNAQVFGKTLVHEFHISYSYTECYLLISLSENGDTIWKQSAVKLTKELYTNSIIPETRVWLFVLWKVLELLSMNGSRFEIKMLLFADDTALVSDSGEVV